MIDVTQFPWRAPLSPDWLARWDAVDARLRVAIAGGETASADLYEAARSLSAERLGLREQIKMENLAARLLTVDGTQSPLPRFRLGLLGNRTLDFLLRPLAAAGLARGMQIEALTAPYDSVSAFAFGQFDPFGRTLDAVTVILDEAAFAPSPALLDADAEAMALANAEAHLDRIAAAIRERTRATPIVATLPDTAPRIASADMATPGSRARFVARLNARIADGAREGRWIVWDLAELSARIGTDRWHDPAAFYAAKSPFAVSLCPLVADRVAALVAALSGRSARAIVLNLDNTLWGGEIGDDGLAGIRLGAGSAEGEAFVAFQHFVKDLHRRGIILAVCSTNTMAIAREPFVSHPEMVLREADIAVFHADWGDKAAAVAAIAERLNLGQDALVLVDDNPFERMRIRRALPLVAVPELGAEPADFPSLIAASGNFEHVVLNRDDLHRAARYSLDAAQAARRSAAGSYDDYLASLGMRLSVTRFDAVDRARIVQLVGKSNQFNLTTRRYNDTEIASFENNTAQFLCWQARLEDCFGDHGMIAVVIVRTAGIEWTIDTWLQSCRVLKRGVEQSLMNLLFAQAQSEGAEVVIGEYIPTSRNGIVSDFFDRMSFSQYEQDSRRYTRAVASFEPLATTIAVELH